MFCTLMIHPFQCENRRVWETGEKGQLERRLHGIMDLEDYLNKKKVRLSCFLSNKRIWGKCLQIPYLGRSQLQLSLFLAACHEKVVHLGWLFLTRIYADDLNKDLSEARQYF